MSFPYVTALTAGLLLILQMALAFTVSGARGQKNAWVGDGGQDALLRAIRRHGNLAENAGVFVAGFLLLELSKFSTALLIGLSVAFVLARVFHAIGLSRTNTNNAYRLIGGIGTYFAGFILGCVLVWIGAAAMIAARAAG